MGGRAFGSAGNKCACSTVALQCEGVYAWAHVHMNLMACSKHAVLEHCSVRGRMYGRRCILERWHAARMQYYISAVRGSYVWAHVHTGLLACSAHAVL